MSSLVDTTEMYLRIVYELEEDGVVPLRARIAERLGQSGPSVSQTVSRMERDGLIIVAGDRHLELTEVGRARAIAVMRKHRLAERLLSDVIGLEWELVHNEACRWEHVMSDQVELKLVALLDGPVDSPYGNPIPGLERLVGPATGTDDPVDLAALRRLDELARRGGGKVVVRRIAEHVQEHPETLIGLREAGLLPGSRLEVRSRSRAEDPMGDGPVKILRDGVESAVPVALARAVLVSHE